MLIAVIGQTASGKSALGLDLAQHYGGPGQSAILGMDAMQLYRGLDVGTAKTPVAERRNIAHYQIDQLDVDEEATAADYQVAARADLAELMEQGTQVVAVGGSGLYVRSLIDEISFPGKDDAVRARLEDELGLHGSRSLHDRLRALDPVSAERIHPHNGKRIVRALEVIEITGVPFASTLPEQTYFCEPTVQLAIAWESADLDARIDQRTADMFAQGLLEETKGVLDRGLQFGRTAARATGYAEALAVVRGELSVDQATESVALATRQLARRQMKWFRRDQRINWLRGDSEVPLLDQALAVIEPQLS